MIRSVGICRFGNRNLPGEDLRVVVKLAFNVVAVASFCVENVWGVAVIISIFVGSAVVGEAWEDEPRCVLLELRVEGS